tara:strand:- start:1072 stop:2304 length:1233 start_codon:yes stop_codon:yes gene_type:complete
MLSNINISLIGILVLLVVINYLKFPTNKKNNNLENSLSSIGWKYLGSENCGWTKEQHKIFGSKNNTLYINCDKEKCDNVDGFPTWINSKIKKQLPGFLNKQQLLRLLKEDFQTESTSKLTDELKKQGWVYYGEDWCGFTKKQHRVLGSESLYRNCKKYSDDCKNIDGFPTWVNTNTGKESGGFKDEDELIKLLISSSDNVKGDSEKQPESTLITALYDNNWRYYGVKSCGWTLKQNETLGSDKLCIYCDKKENKDKCDGVNGFPTWINLKTKKQHPGFKDNTALHKLLKDNTKTKDKSNEILNNTHLYLLDSVTKRIDSNKFKCFVREGCPWCDKQKKIFGDKVNEVEFIDCAKNVEACQQENIQAVPYWVSPENSYSGFLALEKLDELLPYKKWVEDYQSCGASPYSEL